MKKEIFELSSNMYENLVSKNGLYKQAKRNLYSKLNIIVIPTYEQLIQLNEVLPHVIVRNVKYSDGKYKIDLDEYDYFNDKIISNETIIVDSIDNAIFYTPKNTIKSGNYDINLYIKKFKSTLAER